MFDSCARCGAPSGALMVFDYEARSVWLEDLDSDVQPGSGYAFCGSHADRLTPPIGWTLTDRRTLSRLFAPLHVA